MTTAYPPAITDSTVNMTWGPAHTYYGYCTIADVMFEFTNKDNMTTKALTPSAVAQEISYTAINSIQPVLALYYEMPYLGSDPYVTTILREINVKYATVQLIDRYMTANDQTSGMAALYMHRAGAILQDITNGVIRLSDPFGDATPMADLPVYPRASMISVSPNPTLSHSQKPVFRMGRTSFRRRMAF